MPAARASPAGDPLVTPHLIIHIPLLRDRPSATDSTDLRLDKMCIALVSIHIRVAILLVALLVVPACGANARR